MEKMEIKLMHDSIGIDEKEAILNCLNSGEYTQGKIVEDFEKRFAEWNGSKYAIMVNSGSSANLLMMCLAKKKFGLDDGDEILVPSVTWPTTIYPVIQNNLNPVFCDIDESFNMSLDSIKKMTSVKTKGIFLVHLLGQPANIQEILDFAKERDLFVIEDCCESMGARFNNIKVGNFGKMGSFSFYFGHHMTTIEGGMIVTDDEESYDLLKSMRSHGWVRNSKREGLYENYLDKKYLFDIQGYNLRSTNINAAIGLVQLNKLDDFIKKRLENHIYFLDQIKKLGLGFQKVNLSETSSFCFAILFNNQFQRDYILKNLERSKKVETRKIVAGNLLNQPVFKKMSFRKDSASNSEKLDKLGIYIPNNQFIDQTKIDYMLESIKELISESNYFMNLSYQNLGEGKDIMPKQVIN